MFAFAFLFVFLRQGFTHGASWLSFQSTRVTGLSQTQALRGVSNVTLSVTELGVVVHTCNPARRRERPKDPKFQVSYCKNKARKERLASPSHTQVPDATQVTEGPIGGHAFLQQEGPELALKGL